jgi:hypothetical protein
MLSRPRAHKEWESMTFNPNVDRSAPPPKTKKKAAKKSAAKKPAKRR